MSIYNNIANFIDSHGSELSFGFLFGILFFFFIGLWAIPIAILSSILWALGGEYGHSIRFIGVPLVTYGIIYFLNGYLLGYLISGLLTGAVLSIGYGIPDKSPFGDQGSYLGRFWLKMWNKRYSLLEDTPYRLANLFTRATIVLLLAMSSIPSIFHWK